MLNALINWSFKAFSSPIVEIESARDISFGIVDQPNRTGRGICIYKLSFAGEFDKSIGAIHLGRPVAFNI